MLERRINEQRRVLAGAPPPYPSPDGTRACPGSEPYFASRASPTCGGGGIGWGSASEDSTLLIDATLKHSAPPLALPTKQFMAHARAIWEELNLPALAPASPWHGYSLGDWSEAWDRYAERAVAGEWAQSGQETLARRRGGLIPETPVRDEEE